MKTDILEGRRAGACELTLEGGARAYNEPAFQYFLEIERERFKRTRRAFTLLLAELEGDGSGVEALEADVATALLSGLGLSVRDTDFVGWFLDRRIAGAVLTERGGSGAERAEQRLRQRVMELTRSRLPKHAASRLQIRVVDGMSPEDRRS